MASASLNEFLDRLGLLSTRAVTFMSDGQEAQHVLTPEIKNKLALIRPDAYYTFNNQPYILFFDLSQAFDADREDEIHKQAWSFDCAPVIFVIKANQIEVFNAFHYQKRKYRLEPLLENQAEIERHFSFWQIQSGATWQWLQAEKYKETIYKKRVNQRLFDNIKAARQQLETNGVPTDQANVIILRIIFIRYLIDRGVGIKKEFIAGMDIAGRRQSLSDLIRDVPRLYECFDYLNDRFNGALFKQAPAARLKKAQAAVLASLFDSRQDKSNATLFDSFYFDIFDFSIIPVEVISGIYESIIDENTKDADSAIYTPPFLVEYMLTQTVDKFLRQKKVAECKILDPACGSGIFLVQAYRRIVDEERRRNPAASIDSARLREIAEKNLFGIDLNSQALLVTSFSIYIAILDYKEPKEINRFLFPNLIGTNLFAGNFFDEDHEYNSTFKAISFDFLLGNPPWKSKRDDEQHLGYIKRNNLVIGRFEVAQSFLLRTEDFMSPTTRSALIVTSTIFYNIAATTRAFKQNFLTRFSLDIFFDLSAVRKLVFESAISPASIVFYRTSASDEISPNLVAHYSVKPSIFLKYFKTLVIEKFDQKNIPQRYFVRYDWMFKTALYGNTFDFQLLTRMTGLGRTLEDVIDNEHTFFKGSGIKENSGPLKPFPFLVGRPLIENSDVREFYTPVTAANRRLTRKDIVLARGRRPELFDGQHILLKAQTEQESDIVVSYVDQPAVFRHDIFGISSSLDTNFLKVLFAYLVSDLHTYFQFLTNCSWGIATRPAIRLQEFLSFPYLEMGKAGQLDMSNLINKMLGSLRDQETQSFMMPPIAPQPARLREVNDRVNDTYGLTAPEKDLIDYVLTVSRYQFQEGKQDRVLRKVDKDRRLLERYCEVFFSEMNGLYEGEYLCADVYPLAFFVSIHFKLSPEKPDPEDRIHIRYDQTDEGSVLSILSQTLSIWDLTNKSDPSRNIYIQKDIKGFEQNSFYIIKPNEFKCWHPAVAWYDVAEIKSTIEKAEVELLNESK